MERPTVTIIQNEAGVDHCKGVDAALAARGLQADRWTRALTDRTAVLLVADVFGVDRRRALRDAREANVPSILLMDGIVEYRNTYLNPRVGPRFLRPAPVDVVACAGPADARRLQAMGNRAVPTGLPRLADIERTEAPSEPRALVATARQPYFNAVEREVLLDALATIRASLRELGIDAAWRLTGDLGSELGIEPDTTPMQDALAACSFVITTPSTLMVEAMLAGRPTALLHPFETPCWQEDVWRIGPRPGPGDIEPVVASEPAMLARQEELVRDLTSMPRPADALAELCAEVVGSGAAPRAVVQSPRSVPKPPGADRRFPRVVSMVACDGAPLGGVTTWSQRLARAAPSQGYDVRTLLVVCDPDAWHARDQSDWIDERTDVCVIDPADDAPQILSTIRKSLEGLEPDVVLPNWLDACYAAATQLRPSGVRSIAIAHTDAPYYQELIGFYDHFDAAVAVSRQISSWLAPIAQGRPLEEIVYGVPIAKAPRTPADQRPLRLAYLGRMIEMQKRVGDLLLVIDGLERRDVPYEFHIVGDGPRLESWRAELAERNLRSGSVHVHGARSPSWVERFLPTVDACVLVSEYEGTSISMLEAMGQGVVPAVTRVASGVEQWVEDGVSGVTAPVGAPDDMARRLAELAEDRSLVARLGAEAWRRAQSQSIDRMAARYADLFTRVLEAEPSSRKTDTGARLIDSRWADRRSSGSKAGADWARRVLTEAGYRRISHREPGPGADAVIADRTAPVEQARRWRAQGLAVVRLPHLLDETVGDRIDRLAREALAAGHRRIAVYGIGLHTRRAAALFDKPGPFVGFIDDAATPGQTVMELPVVPLDRTEAELSPDAIILSSDVWESRMLERCRPLAERGIEIIPIYAQPPRPGAAAA